MPKVKVEQQLSVGEQSTESSIPLGGSMADFCAAVEKCPDLANGEVRILSHTLDRPAFRLFLEMSEQMQRDHGHRIHLRMNSCNASVCAELERCIQTSRDAGKKMVHCGSISLPVDLDCKPWFSTRLIGDNDPRRALVGQRGVFATKDIVPGCLLGPYRALAACK